MNIYDEAVAAPVEPITPGAAPLEPITLAQDTSAQEQTPVGICVRDTGKACKSWTNADIVEHVGQCAGGKYDPFAGVKPPVTDPSKAIAECSANAVNGARIGTCICAQGFCADVDMRCHSENYLVVSDEFTISVRQWGEQNHLYMLPDGQVQIGAPADLRAAKWRIAVTKSGVKMLYCDLYPESILNEWETCTPFVDQYGLTYQKCDLIVGHAKNPRADEMGWYIELDYDSLDKNRNPYVMLRSAHTGNLFYIDPESKTGRACGSTARNCPGLAGSFHFDPPLIMRDDIMLDGAPGKLPPALAYYASTVVIALVLTCCLGCIYTQNKVLSKLLRPFLKACGCGWIHRGADI